MLRKADTFVRITKNIKVMTSYNRIVTELPTYLQVMTSYNCDNFLPTSTTVGALLWTNVMSVTCLLVGRYLLVG